jgi:hypothetical protein
MDDWKEFSKVWPCSWEMFWYSNGDRKFVGVGWVEDHIDTVMIRSMFDHKDVDTKVFKWWIPLTHPDLPEKEEPKYKWTHECNTDNLKCLENRHGLYLTIKDKHGHWPVSFCPFCGFKPEVKDGPIS